MFKKIVAVAALCSSMFAMGGPALVETTILKKGEVNPLQNFVGTLNFDTKSVLAAQNSGVIKKINIELGDSVKKGKTLVQIDADLLTAQIKAARANLKVARDTLKNDSKDFLRYKKLLETKSITQKEYDDALLKSNSSSGNVQALEANLNELLIQNNKKRIKAPFSGIVVEKKVEIGEWVNAGSEILTLVDTSKAEFLFNVPLNVVDGLKVGDVYDIKVGKQDIKSTLTAIIPNGDKLTRTFPVKFNANLKDKFVFDGQEANVNLSKNGKSQALIIARDAVIKRFGQNVVFVIDDKNTAQMIPVKVLGYISHDVAIAGKGLVEGMNIVVKGNERVFPKSPVKVLNK